MGKTPPLILPLWLAEKEKKKMSQSNNIFLAKIISVFTATISFQAAAFVLALKFLPEKHSRILCSSDLCDRYSTTILVCTLPPLLIFGFALNIALWIGLRLGKVNILTTWMVVYEMIFYLQLFFQLTNLLPLPELIKSKDFLGFIKTWLLPMLLLWLNNNAGQVIFRCREEIREAGEEREKQRQKRLRAQAHAMYAPRSPGQSQSSRGSFQKMPSSSHSHRQMTEFSKTMVLPKINSKRHSPPRNFYRSRQVKSDKISLIS